jgi:hypothetical protein
MSGCLVVMAAVVLTILPPWPPAQAQNAGCQALAEAWEGFERSVRDALLPRSILQNQLETWPRRLKTCYADHRFGGICVFPLNGYGIAETLGSNRNGHGGFVARGYAFLDGNRHGGHPAIDFFVHDRNQDGRDDRTGRAIDVLAIADGVVFSVFDGWQANGPTALVRGGNYTWIYHPALDVFSYYAHLSAVAVRTGQTVTAGQRIGCLGRSGRNAHPQRSPTHLHLMLLNAGDMQPIQPLDLLPKAR